MWFCPEGRVCTSLWQMATFKLNLVALILLVAPCIVTAEYAPSVRIDSGVLVGRRTEVSGVEVDAFLGIPYAETPGGELRFRRPRPAPPWEGAYNATKKPAPCWQLPFDLFGPLALMYSSVASEDCLYVNVWTPARREQCVITGEHSCPEKLLPTVVFIHGGAFQWGDSALFFYDPANFVAQTKDVVFVTFNYRVSAFGFLAAEGIGDGNGAGGNMGLWDQHLALQWVQKNIANFGGDPGRVTLWGHSAGAISVGLHALSPRSSRLFHRAIFQSGAPFTMILAKVFAGKPAFSSIATSLGCYDVTKNSSDRLRDAIACLRKTDAPTFFETLSSKPLLQQWFLPVDNDDFFPHTIMSPRTWNKFAVRDVLIGTTANEGTLFYNLLLRAFPALENALPAEFRVLGTAALSRLFDMPLSLARRLSYWYFGDGSGDDDRTYDQARDTTAAMLGDSFFDCPAQMLADAAAADGVRVSKYVFVHKTSHSFLPTWAGVAHSDDLLYTIGSLPFLKDADRYTDPLGKIGKRFLQIQQYTGEEEEFMKELVGTFAKFIRDGSPALPSAGVKWPAYTQESRQVMSLQPNNFTVAPSAKTELCQLWKQALSVDSNLDAKRPIASSPARQPVSTAASKRGHHPEDHPRSAGSAITPWKLCIVLALACLIKI